MLRFLRAAALGVLVLAATTLPGFAHAHLVSATPAADASISVGPATLVLHFTEGIEPAFTGVALTDEAGQLLATGPAALDAGDATSITVPIMVELAAGRYAVAWHALAVDGHKTTGSYSFRVGP